MDKVCIIFTHGWENPHMEITTAIIHIWIINNIPVHMWIIKTGYSHMDTCAKNMRIKPSTCEYHYTYPHMDGNVHTCVDF
jgi:hypothetical protein